MIRKQKYREYFYKIILLAEIININCKQFFIKKKTLLYIRHLTLLEIN